MVGEPGEGDHGECLSVLRGDGDEDEGTYTTSKSALKRTSVATGKLLNDS